MSTRGCVYKGCKNYIIQRGQGNPVSLFKFPKNPERRKKWMELGQAPNNLPESVYCYCSNHFERKFLSVNKRRTLLLGEAVPVPYEEQKIERFHERMQLKLDDGDNTYVLLEEISESSNSEKQQKLQVESTTTQEDAYCINEDKIRNILNESFIDERSSAKSHVEDSTGIKSSTTDYGEPKRRKLIPTISSTQEDTSFNNGCLTFQHDEEEGSTLLLNPYASPSSLINTDHISTFTFKGEDVVQMSKDYYVNEKIELLKKIHQLECVLNAIKNQVVTIDF